MVLKLVSKEFERQDVQIDRLRFKVLNCVFTNFSLFEVNCLAG